MASGSFNLNRTGSTSSYITFKCNWSSTSNGAIANSSTVKVTIIASKSSSSTANTYGNYTATATVDDSAQSVGSTSFTLAPGKSITLLSKSYTVPHNADGTKTTTISASVGGNVMYGNGSASITLDKIPRYGTSNQTLTSKTETSITMNWNSDSVVDYIWYSTNDGSSWNGINVTDGTNGSYTINGLAANTTYQVRTRIRRKDSQLTTDSTALTVTTYAYPYCNSMPSFTIGSKLLLGFYNPLRRSITVNIIGADGSQISNDTTTSTSISGYNGEVVVNRLYNSIPNTKSATYKVRVTYNGHLTTKTGGTYTVNPTQCSPTIGTVSYRDTNSTCTAITGNNQQIIRNQSKVQFTANGLSANKAATLSNCKVTINANNYNMTVSGTTATVNNINIDSATSLTANITVTDSRGITASKTLNITMIDWILPTAIINLQRQHNYYSQTDINVNADYSSIDSKNTITIKARYKKTTDQDYSADVTLQDEITSVLNLDNRFEWDVQVEVKDLFGTTTYNLTIGKGLPIVFFDRVLRSVGFNCFPVESESVEINGVNISRNVMTRSLSAQITNLAVNTYTIIPLNLSNSAGSKLTATNDGGIQIGPGITKVLISGQMALEVVTTAGNRHVRIVKNNYSAANTLGWGWDNLQIGDTESITISPQLVNVAENDVIYLYYYTSNSADKIGGNEYGGRTSLTVDTVQ